MYRKYFQFSGLFVKTFLPSSNSTNLNINTENHLLKRWAGHSKWQNIKSVKQAADHNKSMIYQRLANLMKIAVKQNGADPAVNNKLKLLLEEAKKANMPKATVERILKTAQSSATDKPYWAVFSGPKGVVLGLEVAFANNKPGFLVTKLQGHTKKLKLKMETHFSHLCVERGIIITDPLENAENSYEKALEDAIDIGIDEVHENEDKSLIFECIPDRVDSYTQQLIKKGYNVQSANTELDFKAFVSLKEEEVNDIEKLVANLQNLYEEVLRASYNAVQN